MLTKEGVTLKWKTLMAAAVGMSIVALVVVVQAQRAAQTSSLTPQDYVEIQQLVNRYPYTFDGALGRGAAYADLFTSDGVFINASGRREGREALMKFVGATRPQETPDNVAHFLSNAIIEPAPGGGAKGKQYLHILGLGTAPPDSKTIPPVVVRMGHYEDIYQKTPQGWRFKERHVIFDPRTARTPAASR